MIKLSIITPYYNCLDYIMKLAKILEPQLTDETEWIIIDDGCNEQKLDKFKAKIIHLEKNWGVAKARNIGLDNATGEYISFLDSDDLVINEYINILLEKIKLQKSIYVFNWYLDNTNNLGFKWPGKLSYYNVWSHMFKKSYINNERFDENLQYGEDSEWLQRVIKSEEDKFMCNEALVRYNSKNQSSLSHKFYNKEIKEIKKDYKLSIIIPCFNSSQWIEKCINSIPDKDNIEIICINDASTDDTLEKIKKLKEIKDIKIITRENNYGVGYSRNEGIEIAKGEYILFLDSDDFLYDKLDEFLSHLNNNIDIVYYALRENDGVVLTPTKYNCGVLCGTVKAIKRSFLGDSRYPHVNFAEDYILNQELLAKNPTQDFTNIILLHYNHPREGSLFDIAYKKNQN